MFIVNVMADFFDMFQYSFWKFPPTKVLLRSQIRGSCHSRNLKSIIT